MYIVLTLELCWEVFVFFSLFLFLPLQVRELFKSPDVLPAEQVDLKWTDPDEEGLLKYLVEEKQFNEERVKKGLFFKKNKHHHHHHHQALSLSLSQS